MCTAGTRKKYAREEEGKKGRKETHLMENPIEQREEGLPGICKPPASRALSKVGRWLPDDLEEQGIL